MTFRQSHPTISASALVDLYNSQVTISSGEAVTKDFLYAAQIVYESVLNRPDLAQYILWVSLLHVQYLWCLIVIMWNSFKLHLNVVSILHFCRLRKPRESAPLLIQSTNFACLSRRQVGQMLLWNGFWLLCVIWFNKSMLDPQLIQCEFVNRHVIQQTDICCHDICVISTF